MSEKTARIVLLFAVVAAGSLPIFPEPGDVRSAAAEYFGDVVLVDQDGREMRLYSDLLEDKVVVIESIFTTCTGVCPILSKKLSELQAHLGERVGRDVHLISISVDPVNDTPAKLKEYAARFGARPGWYFLTGEEGNVRAALEKLGLYVEDKDNHQAVVLVGNLPTGLWKKAFGLADTAEFVAVVDSVLNDEGPEPPQR